MPCRNDPVESFHSSNFLLHEKETVDINYLSKCNASEQNHDVGDFHDRDKYRSKLIAFQLIQNSLDTAGVRVLPKDLCTLKQMSFICLSQI